MFAPMTSSLVDLLALNEFGGHSLRCVAPENTLEAVRQGTLHKIGQGGVVQHHGVKFVARLKAAHLAEESAADNSVSIFAIRVNAHAVVRKVDIKSGSRLSEHSIMSAFSFGIIDEEVIGPLKF